MKHKVAELEGALLEEAVALSEGWKRNGRGWQAPIQIRTSADRTVPGLAWEQRPWPWSREWMYGGALIERERIAIWADATPIKGIDEWNAGLRLDADVDFGFGPGCALKAEHHSLGPTPLIAAMRAYVASKVGQEVDLP